MEIICVYYSLFRRYYIVECHRIRLTHELLLTALEEIIVNCCCYVLLKDMEYTCLTRRVLLSRM
jgi:hypothetical protein